jgi:hypothetical protein
VLARKSAHADYASLRAPEVVRPSTMRAVSRAGTPKDVAYRARALRARAGGTAKNALNISAIVVVKDY